MNHTELLDLLLKAVDIVRADAASVAEAQVTPEVAPVVPWGGDLPWPVETPVVPVEASVSVVEASVPVVEASVPVVAIDKALFPAGVHGLLDLLMSDKWPEAAPAFLICEDTEDDKMERAEGILDYIGDNLTTRKVLDFGCGEGHVALKASETAVKSVGYDIVKSGTLAWESWLKPSLGDKCLLTTDFAKVAAEGPYDLVILYDVLDHCVDPVAALNQIKSVCTPQAKIFVRCHSWMSRHGAHLYKQLNKAWLHVFFTEEELVKMGLKMEFTQKYVFPIAKQTSWFNEVGLKTHGSDVIKTAVEPFFRQPALVARYPAEFKGQFPEFQMSQVFNDYKLGI